MINVLRSNSPTVVVWDTYVIYSEERTTTFLGSTTFEQLTQCGQLSFPFLKSLEVLLYYEAIFIF